MVFVFDNALTSSATFVKPTYANKQDSHSMPRCIVRASERLCTATFMEHSILSAKEDFINHCTTMM